MCFFFNRKNQPFLKLLFDEDDRWARVSSIRELRTQQNLFNEIPQPATNGNSRILTTGQNVDAFKGLRSIQLSNRDLDQ